jgi:hypothetical protein
MLALKDVLIVMGLLFLIVATGIALYDLWKVLDYPRRLARIAAAGEQPEEMPAEPGPVRWQPSVGLGLAAFLPLLIAAGMVIIPAGMGGVRVSQLRGTLPGTLYSGAHFVTPLVDSVQMFDLRDKLFTAGVVEGMPAVSDKKVAVAMQPLDVQSKRVSTSGWRLRCVTGWIRAVWITSRRICRSRWMRRWCRRWWRVRGAIWLPHIPCGKFSARIVSVSDSRRRV